jgi:transposase
MLGFEPNRECQMITKRRFYPEVFKRESVARVTSSGLSVGAVATELGLHESVLRQWVRESGIAGAEVVRRSSKVLSLPTPSDLASENARLRRENDRLRMECDILKKPRSSSKRLPDEVRVCG